jgi:hypothetical protein
MEASSLERQQPPETTFPENALEFALAGILADDGRY